MFIMAFPTVKFYSELLGTFRQHFILTKDENKSHFRNIIKLRQEESLLSVQN